MVPTLTPPHYRSLQVCLYALSKQKRTIGLSLWSSGRWRCGIRDSIMLETLVEPPLLENIGISQQHLNKMASRLTSELRCNRERERLKTEMIRKCAYLERQVVSVALWWCHTPTTLSHNFDHASQNVVLESLSGKAIVLFNAPELRKIALRLLCTSNTLF